VEAEAATSPQITVLLAIAAVAAIWMFLWIGRPASSTGSGRTIPTPGRRCPGSTATCCANAALPTRRQAIPDPYFAHEYDEIAPLRNHIVIAGAIAGGALVLIAIGTRFLGWRF